MLLRIQSGGEKTHLEQDRFLFKNATLKGHKIHNKNVFISLKILEISKLISFWQMLLFCKVLG